MFVLIVVHISSCTPWRLGYSRLYQLKVGLPLLAQATNQLPASRLRLLPCFRIILFFDALQLCCLRSTSHPCFNSRNNYHEYQTTTKVVCVGFQVLLKKNMKPPELPQKAPVRKVKPEDLEPKVNRGKTCILLCVNSVLSDTIGRRCIMCTSACRL